MANRCDEATSFAFDRMKNGLRHIQRNITLLQELIGLRLERRHWHTASMQIPDHTLEIAWPIVQSALSPAHPAAIFRVQAHVEADCVHTCVTFERLGFFLAARAYEVGHAADITLQVSAKSLEGNAALLMKTQRFRD